MTDCVSIQQRISDSRLSIVQSVPSATTREFTGSEALRAGRKYAQTVGVSDGERVVLLLLPHSPELFCLQIALALDGHLPAILPWPTSRIDARKYQRNLLYQLAELPAARLVTLPQLAANLAPGLPFTVSALPIEGFECHEKGFREKFEADLPRAVTGDKSAQEALPHDALFLQFSGGTTGMQKCVVVTEAMLRQQLDCLEQALGFTKNDTVLSWLPMYHDMGLIACLWLPLWCGGTSVHMSASDWLMAPQRLLELVDVHQGTFCWLPNFAFSYLAQRKDGMRGQWQLGSMRAWVNCSEPVRLHSMMAFAEAFRDWGVIPESLQACYAMAETVFAVTQTTLGEGPKVVARNKVLASSNGRDRLQFSMPDEAFTSSGRILPGNAVRIVGSACDLLADGEAGEIQLKSASIFGGYWGRGGFHRECFTEDGWYRTGDYGFVQEGEVFVIGRIKDLIIVGGQNIFPEDVELVVNSVRGIYPGRVVAFGIEDADYGTQALTIVAELRDKVETTGGALEREVRSQVLSSIGVAPRYVKLAPERWIVKSTAGKISRRETREKFLQELTTGEPQG